MLRLVLYDPTNYGTGGFSVALFEKAENGLPKVDAGDILMLRSVQVRPLRPARYTVIHTRVRLTISMAHILQSGHPSRGGSGRSST